MSAIINVLKSLFSVGEGQARQDFKSRVEQIIIRLELLQERVTELRYKFETRFRELWDKIVSFMRRGDEERARVYAGEAAQLRSMIRVVKTVENMVLMTVERLKTVKDAKELTETLMAFSAALEDVKEQTKGLYPGLAYALEDVTRSVKSLIVQTSVESLPHIDPIAVSSKSLEILNEAAKQAAMEIKKKFPEPPVEPIMRVAETDTASVPEGKPRRRKPEKSLEELLLDYIREHGGFLDVKDFIERYGYSRDEVFEALKRMAEKGLITLA